MSPARRTIEPVGPREDDENRRRSQAMVEGMRTSTWGAPATYDPPVAARYRENFRTLTARVTPDVADELRRRAAAQETTVSAVVSELLADQADRIDEHATHCPGHASPLGDGQRVQIGTYVPRPLADRIMATARLAGVSRGQLIACAIGAALS